MTMQKAKNHFVAILNDPENRVVALSGKWGTGKSHMWRDIQQTSTDEVVKKALYVSLFGVSDMAQLKLKIVQSAIGAGNGAEILEGIKSTGRAAIKLLRAVHPGLAALDEIAALVVPAILRNRFIVIDDIERKHDRLSIDEVLGFIDEYTQSHGARIQLILNSDQLQDKTLWETLREKVIDQEVTLDTSPAEAFDIAIKLTCSRFSSHIRSAVEICRITNIRIIRKVIKAVNRILDGYSELPVAVLVRVIPSTVLLSAIYYKGMENGPDFDYVLNAEKHHHQEAVKADEKHDGATAQLLSKWNILLGELKINSCDEYEVLVVDYLKSGLFDASSVASIVSRYASETRLMETQSRASALCTSIWRPEVSDADLVKKAEALVVDVHLLDCYSVTSLHDAVVAFEGGQEIAKKLISSWITEFRKKKFQEFSIDNFSHGSVHPLILAEFNAVHELFAGKLSLADICRSISCRQMWGRREATVMRGATVTEYEELLRTLSGDALKMFLLNNINFYTNRVMYEKDFGRAMEYFVEACRKICLDGADIKRGKLFRLVFDGSSLGSALEPLGVAEPVHRLPQAES